MNITTTYKTNPTTGEGSIEARSGDRRKTRKYDHSRSVNENHGLAAGALVNVKFPENVESILEAVEQGRVQRVDLGSGKQKFVI